MITHRSGGFRLLGAIMSGNRMVWTSAQQVLVDFDGKIPREILRQLQRSVSIYCLRSIRQTRQVRSKVKQGADLVIDAMGLLIQI